jgi:hypothetical protein
MSKEQGRESRSPTRFAGGASAPNDHQRALEMVIENFQLAYVTKIIALSVCTL